MVTMQSHNSARPHFIPQSRAGRIVAVVLFAVLIGLAVEIACQLLPSSPESPGPDSPDPRPRPRRIVKRDGRRLLWARGDRDSDDAEWFDVTDSKIDPQTFEFGIGKDTIASIDAPQFVDADDPHLGDFGIDDRTLVIGFVHDGDARAYPLKILDEHELVNDTVGGKPVTVGW